MGSNNAMWTLWAAMVVPNSTDRISPGDERWAGPREFIGDREIAAQHRTNYYILLTLEPLRCSMLLSLLFGRTQRPSAYSLNISVFEYTRYRFLTRWLPDGWRLDLPLRHRVGGQRL